MPKKLWIQIPKRCAELNQNKKKQTSGCKTHWCNALLTKNKGLFLILIATNIWQCVLSLSHPFILKQHREHELSFFQKDTWQVNKNKARWTQLQSICCKTNTLILQRWRPSSSMRCSRNKHTNFIFPIRQLGLNFAWHCTQPPLSHLLSLSLSPSRTKQSSQSVYNAEEFPCGPGM